MEVDGYFLRTCSSIRATIRDQMFLIGPIKPCGKKITPQSANSTEIFSSRHVVAGP